MRYRNLRKPNRSFLFVEMDPSLRMQQGMRWPRVSLIVDTSMEVERRGDSVDFRSRL